MGKFVCNVFIREVIDGADQSKTKKHSYKFLKYHPNAYKNYIYYAPPTINNLPVYLLGSQLVS